MNTVFTLTLLFGGFYYISGDELNCDFKTVNYTRIFGSFYSCVVTELDNRYNNMTITGYKGIHEANRTDDDVKVIYSYWAEVDFIPTEIGMLFKLTGLFMQYSEIKEVTSSKFQGMEELEYLDLSSNHLTELPADAFETLPELRILFLLFNQIEGLPDDLFMNNTNLEYIDFIGNPIKYISSDLFDGLPKVTLIVFQMTACLNKMYNGTTAIAQLKDDILMNCYIPTTTAIAPVITSGTTTSKPPPMQELLILVCFIVVMSMT